MTCLPHIRAVLFLGLLLLGVLTGAGCDAGSTDDGPEVSVIDLTVGSGLEAVQGARVTVHYLGKLTSGEVFDSSYKQHKPSLETDSPFTFTLGADEVIRGWERGIPGMRVGGKRRLIIPPELGYRNQAQGCTDGVCLIPPNSTLVFDIDLLDVALPKAPLP